MILLALLTISSHISQVTSVTTTSIPLSFATGSTISSCIQSTVAILGNGTLVGWGRQPVSTPPYLPLSTIFISVSMGAAHACALTTLGVAICW
jgi:hypothetical protein